MVFIINYFKSKYKTIENKNRRLIVNSMLSFVIMGLSLLTSMFLLPAYMRFFPNQKILGFWFTALSVLSWVLTFDLGIGNGLRNKLVEALANNDNIRVKKYISSAYLMVGVVVVIVSLAGFYIFPTLNLNSIFNISKNIIDDLILLSAVRIIFLGIMLQFFLRLINSIMYALQQSFMPNLLSLFSNLLLLLYISFSKESSSEVNIINLALANVITANFPVFIATIIIFFKKLKYAVPSFSYYENSFAKSILKLGGVFFWIQIMYMIITNTNEFLITWSRGSEYVVEFKIYNSLFGIVSSLFLLTLTPVWSEVTEAHVKKQFDWIKNLYKRLYLLGFLGLVALVILIFILQFLVDVWLKEKSIKINYFYAFTFAIAMMLSIWSSILSTLAGGLGKLKILIIFMTIGAILNFPLTILFTSLTNSWIGVVISNIFSLLPLCIAQTIWLKKYFKISFNE